jgi:hypothetical protein
MNRAHHPVGFPWYCEMVGILVFTWVAGTIITAKNGGDWRSVRQSSKSFWV